MNDPLNNPMNNPAPQQAPAPGGWTPQQPAPQVPAQPSSEPVSSPFETPPAATIPVAPGAPIGSDPVMMEPAGPKSNIGLFIILGVLLIVGGVVGASMLGWINFGKFLGGTPTPSAIVSPSPNVVVNKNDQQRKADLANIKTALGKYYNDKQSYPVVATMEKTTDPNSALGAALVPTYLTALPVDPLSPNSYYGYKSDGKSFTLTASLEDRSDPSGITTGSVYLYTVTDISFETPSTNTATGSNITPEPVTPTPTDTATANTDSSSSSSSGSGSADSSANAGATLQ